MTGPHYADESVTLHHGDCLEVLTGLPDDSVDSVCTDPPYGLGFMGKAWDARFIADTTAHRQSYERHPLGGGPNGGFKSAAANAGRYDLSASALFEFQVWVRQWALECYRVLKPGGHIVAFGGSRTWHRLAVGIEDAGFQIRDSIAWLYASGFPKSMDVSDAVQAWQQGQAIDQAPAVIRDGVYTVTAYLKTARDKAGWTNRQIDALFGTNGMSGHWVSQGSQPAVPSVRQWETLKRALGFGDEMDALVAELGSVERPEDWGAGDGQAEPFLSSLQANPDHPGVGPWGTAMKPAFEPIVVGRKPPAGTLPANIQTWGTGALNIEGCRTAMSEVDRDNFTKGAAAWKEHSARHGDGETKAAEIYGVYGNEASPANPAGRWPANVVLDDHAAAELDGQTPWSRDGVAYYANQRDDSISIGPTGLKPQTDRPPAGYGGEGGTSRFFPRFRYEAKAPTSERPKYWRHTCECPHDRPATPGGSCPTCLEPYANVAHPTVKPLDLMRWLVRLVTPPGGVVLEPFTGSGTTAEACILEGMRCIAIEREADYLPLIVQRLSKPLQPALLLEGL